MEVVKPGWKTTEFWISIVMLFLTDASVLPIPHQWRAPLSGIILFSYSFSRGLAKLGYQSVIPEPPLVLPPVTNVSTLPPDGIDRPRSAA